LLVIFSAAIFVYGSPGLTYAEINPAEVASNTEYIEYAILLPVKLELRGFQGLNWFVRMYVASFMPGMASLDESEYSALL
jgi:hypothetical protein